MIDRKDRALGAFIGLAVGDALGAPVEFKEPGEFTPITKYRSGGPFNLPKGYWTDDTSMAICLAKSILQTDKIDHVNLLQYFARWYQNGENSSTGRCFDIGNTTAGAIRKFIKTKTYEPAEDRFDLSGNGSIMRLAPVPIRWFNDEDYMKEMCRQQSLTTHGSKECQECSIELGTLISNSINGLNIKVELSAFAWQQTEVPNSGRALDTMVAAKWAVGSTTNFEDAVLAAVNLGGDADTIAAVAGQIAGSIYGLKGIKQEFIDGLFQYNVLLNIAEELYNRNLNVN